MTLAAAGATRVTRALGAVHTRRCQPWTSLWWRRRLALAGIVCVSSRGLIRCLSSTGGEVSMPRRASRPPQVHTDAFPTPMEVNMQTIAIARSPYKERFGCPRQPTVTAGVAGGEAATGLLELVPSERNPEAKLRAALQDLAGFEFIWVISYLHMNEGWSARVTPPRGPRQKRGLFATRAPHRPNHIGLSACRLMDVDTATLRGLS
ncbi:trmO [Symbiodinium natans]|uniref:TrmO protein n=1 Tax=Symbiodinium natans TaxID=878477 RepID=A0A812PWF1_9DINO|nr:trmO [Symbiodinium natans]